MSLVLILLGAAAKLGILALSVLAACDPDRTV